MNSDFSKYRFQHYEDAINIGFKVSAFSQASSDEKQEILDLPEGFLEKLKDFCDHPLNVERDGIYRLVKVDGKECATGFGEIRILGPVEGLRYAAPNVIYNDIVEGRYLPPMAFVLAVMNAPAYDSAEFQDFLSRYNEDNFWAEDAEATRKRRRLFKLFHNDFESFMDEIIADSDAINTFLRDGNFLNLSLKENDHDKAMWVLEHGIDVSTLDGEELLAAIENEDLEVIDMLIKQGVPVDVDAMNTNPLFLAIRKKNLEMISMLGKAFPKCKVTYNNEFVQGMDAVKMAERTKDAAVIELVKAL